MDGIRLPRREKLLLDEYVGRLVKTYAGDLVAVVLYGSAASGEFAPRHSNINLLVVLKETGLVAIARASGLVRSFRFRSINPVFLTESFIKSSTDTFPIEFLDMKENYSVLHGKDVLNGLAIDIRNLRFQCEHELKSKLIVLKRRYIQIRSPKELEQLLFRSFTSCMHILRNILRLKGMEPPYLKADVLTETERSLSVDMTILNEILWAKTKGMKLSHADIDALLIGLVKELEAITAVVDTL